MIKEYSLKRLKTVVLLFSATKYELSLSLKPTIASTTKMAPSMSTGSNSGPMLPIILRHAVDAVLFYKHVPNELS